MKTRLCQLFAWLAALYAAVLCVLYFQQENLLFHPAKLPAHYTYTFRLITSSALAATYWFIQPSKSVKLL